MTEDSAIQSEWWPKWLGDPSKAKDLSYIVWGIVLVGFVLPFGIVVGSNHRLPDADFAEFYSLGRILNEYSPLELYNYDLQQKICQEVHFRGGGYGPLPYPPFVALFFRAATLLPYWAAYVAWVTICLALYGAGLRLIVARFFSQERALHSLLYALGYAYFPFLAYTAGNGQFAAVGFFAIALALSQEHHGRFFLEGLALSLCLYKPTILLLLLPMLLVTRRFKALLGFCCGALLLILLTTAFEGFAVWGNFFHALFSFGNSSVGVTNHSILPLAKYVDLASFSSNLPGGRSTLAIAALLSVSLAAFVVLVRFWWASPGRGETYNGMLWAATLTCTLILNVYVPLYDSILVVLAILITAGTLRQTPESRGLQRVFFAVWVAILICSWCSVPLSNATGVQCMTLLFACLAVVQFVNLRKLSATPSAQLPSI